MHNNYLLLLKKIDCNNYSSDDNFPLSLKNLIKSTTGFFVFSFCQRTFYCLISSLKLPYKTTFSFPLPSNWSVISTHINQSGSTVINKLTDLSNHVYRLQVKTKQRKQKTITKRGDDLN